MSILIKGIDMPEKYGRCITIFSDGRVTTEFGAQVIAYAVPIPPHGDLIDRDALPWENQGYMLTDPDEWGLKIWDIEHAPTIIEAEEG